MLLFFFSLSALNKYLWTTLEQYRSSDVVIVHQVSEFVFNVSPSVKAIWRLGHGHGGTDGRSVHLTTLFPEQA